MFELVGSTELWQWDTGRQIDCAGLQAGTKVQFAYSDTQTLSTAVKTADGASVADVPNQLLLRPGALMVYAYVTEADGVSYTKYSARFNVQARPKPDDYVYTPTELKSWQTIRDEIGDLDDLTTTAKNNLVAAINEAAASGGGGGGSVTKDSIVTALGYTPANAPDVLLCTISGAGTSASPFTCDKTTAQIHVAAQAGKQVYVVTGGIFLPLSFVSEHTARFTKVTSTDTLNGMQGYATLVTVQSNGKVSVKQTGLEQTSNKVNTISASSTVAEYPSANAVWDAIPHPEAKTDAMTQAVGKDADGKLWTAPGGGGSSSGIELVYTWTADGTTMSAINDLTIEPGKLYFCETIVINNADLTANVTTPLVNVKIGSEGNTFTGMIVGTVTGQQKYSTLQSRWTFFVLGGTIHSVSDRTQNSQNVPTNSAYKANKIYIYSATSDVNIISGTTVNIYKMG